MYEYSGNCWDPLIYPRARAVSEFGWQSYSNLASMAEVLSPESWNYWSSGMNRRDSHPSQPPQTILFKNVGQNWRIPGIDGASAAPPFARDNRLVGSAASAAAAARAANQTSSAYTRRSDGTYSLPTDARGLAAMLAQAPGGPAAGVVFRDVLLLTQLAQAQCVTTEASKYRRIQTECPRGGTGGCTMVSLYWMGAGESCRAACAKTAMECYSNLKTNSINTRVNRTRFRRSLASRNKRRAGVVWAVESAPLCRSTIQRSILRVCLDNPCRPCNGTVRRLRLSTSALRLADPIRDVAHHLLGMGNRAPRSG